MNFNSIVALSKNKGIGLNNKLPWKVKNDLQRFKQLTIGNNNNSVIMGKNTWLSVKFLKNRHNYIISNTLEINDTKDNYEIKSFKTIDLLINYLKTKEYDVNWVIGGGQIYKTFINRYLINKFYITYIDKEIHCDAFMISLPKYFLKKKCELSNEKYENNNIYYLVYEKIKKDDILIYKNKEKCIVKDIHHDDYPNIYITIKIENKEIQTIIENLSL